MHRPIFYLLLVDALITLLLTFGIFRKASACAVTLLVLTIIKATLLLLFTIYTALLFLPALLRPAHHDGLVAGFAPYVVCGAVLIVLLAGPLLIGICLLLINSITAIAYYQATTSGDIEGTD